MRIQSTDTISSLPITTIRDVLKLVTINSSFFEKDSPLDFKEINSILHGLYQFSIGTAFKKDLEKRGFIKRESNKYFLTEKGISFSNAKTEKEVIPRKRAETILDELVGRIEDLNSARVSSMHRIPVLILFGSMLSDSAEVGDIDVVWTHPNQEGITKDIYTKSLLTALIYKDTSIKKLFNIEEDFNPIGALKSTLSFWFSSYLNFSPYISSHHLLELASFLIKDKNFKYKILIGDTNTIRQQYFEITELFHAIGRISATERVLYEMKFPF